MAKYCLKCGEQLENGEFCNICGTVVTPQRAETPPVAQPQYPEQPAQPQYDYSQQQYGSQRPQQPNAPPHVPSQISYGQPSAPAKKKKKTMLTLLIVTGAVAIAAIIYLLVLLPPSKVDITDSPESGDQEVTGEVGEEDIKEEEVEEEVEVIREEEDEEDEEDEDEEDNTVQDEPPFLTTLRTGVYGYEMHMIATKDDATVEGDSFVYSNGFLIAIGVIDIDGEVLNRYIYDCETHMLHYIIDELKVYAVQENCDFWYKFGIPEFRSGLEESGKGTTEFEGETLDYMDCGSGEDAVRVLIKDGDVYAFQHNNNNWEHTLYLLQTYSSPPTTEYFEIPDDYEQEQTR